MGYRRFFLFVVLTLAGCGRDTAATTRAAGGPSVTSAAGPRIISTVPAATLNLVLIGATDCIVGVTKYDHIYLSDDKQNLPVVGDYEAMDYEQLVGLKPTALAIQIAESRISPRLREVTSSHHIELVNLRFDHIDDIWGSVQALGKATQREAAAKDAIDNAQRELKDLKTLYGTGPKPKVLYLVSPQLKLIAGGKSFIEEMISMAGGENVGAKAGIGFLEVGREAMVKLAPEVLLVGAPNEIEEQPNDPRLEAWITLPVPAARNKRVYLVTDGNAQTASVDIGRNVRALAELIHRGDPLLPPAPAAPATQKAGNP